MLNGLFRKSNLLKKFTLLIFSLCTLTSCEFPRDPNSTLDNIKKYNLIKIGICEDANQNELNVLLKLSQQLNSRIDWVKENQENLYRKLENKEIAIVACNIKNDSPWQDKLAFTHSYSLNTKNVFAVQQGENQWLKYVNDFIFQYRET